MAKNGNKAGTPNAANVMFRLTHSELAEVNGVLGRQLVAPSLSAFAKELFLRAVRDAATCAHQGRDRGKRILAPTG